MSKEDFLEKASGEKSGANSTRGFVIPAIDIIEGKCVRLVQGDFSQKKIYHEDPLEVAKQFADAGLQRLHLVDLDGARAGRVMNWKVLEKIAAKTELIIDFGGGIKTEKDLQIALNSGARLITIGSLAVKDENLFSSWIHQYGPDLFFLGADVRNEKIAIQGWTESTEISIYDFIGKYRKKKIQHVFCTDVQMDGLLSGPSLDLYREILARHKGLQLVASGGVASLDDIFRVRETGCSGVIVGKAIYEGRISLKDLSKI